ncbi:MAG: TAXI family TRAP transporter solute-binding subunit [Pseudomonadota bacterium]
MRDFLKIYGPLALLAVIGVLIALRFVDPAPPKSITFATGGADGAYAAYGARYANLLAEHGVEVTLLNTAGSVDNLRLLRDGEADVALVQGGLATEGDRGALNSLGGLFYEPFWVFVRGDLEVEDFDALKPLRVGIGGEGSGTRMLATDLRRDYGPGWGPRSALPISGAAAANALVKGDLDAAVFAAGISAPYVDRLLREPDIRLLPFARAPALSQRRPALDRAVLLHGVVDIARDVPPVDVPMIAPVAQLVVDRDLHPAIQSILLEAAAKIHREHSLLADAGTFPADMLTDLPLSDEAARYYRNGPSALRRYFSFGVANFLERAWVLAIPLLTLLFPLIRAAPPVYRWRIRRKIYVWYNDLRELEEEGREATSNEARAATRDKLSKLQAEIGKLDVPLSYNDEVYRLRNHVAFVNQLLGNLDPTQKIEPMV